MNSFTPFHGGTERQKLVSVGNVLSKRYEALNTRLVPAQTARQRLSERPGASHEILEKAASHSESNEIDEAVFYRVTKAPRPKPNVATQL